MDGAACKLHLKSLVNLLLAKPADKWVDIDKQSPCLNNAENKGIKLLS
jgi:hypothetical protein